MASQSLYRKHRPQSFSELVGQESVSTALRNAVREDRTGHAYLFSGPRGTGKTTTARILAKALNCKQRSPEGEPCNRCPSCLEITAGTSMDVVELDAASNRGVSEMRALLERVAYRSAGGDWKVYIVDEVHMLTKEASTALLKTLEEPPGHVVFVLATTDPQMVQQTIKSRTQHFEFSLIPADLLAEHLAEIARREGIEADPEALRLVARRGAGSARDALSLLDQALAYGEGKLLPEQVKALFGGTPFAARAAIVDALGAGDVADLLGRLDDLLGGGVDARQLADDLLRHLREVFLLLSAKGRVRVEAPEEERARLLAQGESLGAGAVVRALESLGEAAIEIRRAPDPRLVLEVALVRLARADGAATSADRPASSADGPVVPSADALAERVARLERAVEELRRMLTTGSRIDAGAPGGGAARPGPSPAPPAGPRAALGALRARPASGSTAPARRAETAAVPPPAGAGAPGGGPPPAASAPPTGAPSERRADVAGARSGGAGSAIELDAVRAAWPRALVTFKPRLKAMAKEAVPVQVDGTTVTLGLPARFERVHLPTIQGEADVVAGALSAELGQAVRIKVVLDDSEGATRATPEEADVSVEDGAAFADEIAEPRPAGQPGAVDSPLGLVIETFGATVESEIIRE